MKAAEQIEVAGFGIVRKGELFVLTKADYGVAAHGEAITFGKHAFELPISQADLGASVSLDAAYPIYLSHPNNLSQSVNALIIINAL